MKNKFLLWFAKVKLEDNSKERFLYPSGSFPFLFVQESVEQKEQRQKEEMGLPPQVQAAGYLAHPPLTSPHRQPLEAKYQVYIAILNYLHDINFSNVCARPPLTQQICKTLRQLFDQVVNVELKALSHQSQAYESRLSKTSFHITKKT